MRLSPTYLRLVLAGLLFPYLFSCSRHSADLPVPTASVQAPELTISEVQTWYQQHYATTFSTSPATLSNGSSSRTAAGGSTPLRHTHLVWPRALTVGHGAQTLVLVPLAGDQAQALFAGHWQGTRYLVVTKKENQALDGNLLELLLRRTNTPVDTLALFTSLYRSYHAGQVAAPPQGEGYLIAYTPGYVHIAGKHFLNGQLLAGNVRLKFFPSSNSSHLKGGSATSPQVPNGSGTLPTSPIANATNGGCGTYYNSGNGEDEYIDTIDCGNYVYDGNPDPTMPDGGGYSGPGDYGGTSSGSSDGGSYDNGGGDSDYAVSNANSEYVDPNKKYTAAQTPPSATEYNCAELRNTHPDDRIQTSLGGVVNIDRFVYINQGYDRNAIIGQRGYQNIAPGISMSMGPNMRYIQDPLNPDVVIDLRHMLTVAYYGYAFGNSVEVIEGLGGHPGSYDHQDYFSNQLGYDFYRNYKDRIDTNPSYFAYYLSDYLKDASLRSPNTDPVAIDKQCP